MPSKPLWFNRIREIRATLESDFPAPWVDRATISELFAVGKRRAHGLMRIIGVRHIGGAYAVSQQDLLSWLDALERSPEVERELRRQRRVHSIVEEARMHMAARRVSFQVPSPAPQPRIASLPPTIALRPGVLRIEFQGTADLLKQLYELGQAVMNDYEGFEQLVGSEDETPPQILRV